MKKREKGKINFGLKNKLILSFLVILLIPCIVISVSSYQSAKNEIDDQMEGLINENVSIVNQSITQFISGQMENIDYLSNAISAGEIENDSNADIRKLLDTIQSSKPDVEQTYVGTETGQFMNSPTSFKNPPEYDPRERPWYKEAKSNAGKVIVTDPYVSQSSNQVVVTLAKATADGQGVVAVNLKLGNISEMMSEIKIGENGYLFLMDDTGKYISHPENEAGTEGSEKYKNTLLSAESQTLNIKDDNENDVKLSYITNELTGWKIGGVMHQEEVDHAVAPIFYTTIIVIVLSLVIGGVIIFYIIRSITKPIQVLVDSANSMSQGDLSTPIKLVNNDELGVLANTFNHLRENLGLIISEVREKSNNLAASSEELTASTEQNTSATEQISSSIQEMSAGVELQAQGIEESSKMAKTMSLTIQEIAESSNEVSNTAIEAKEVVERGSEAIEITVGQMNFIKHTVNEIANSIKVLGNHSQQISQIVDVITAVAEQTNLLALNAAIEAARAGEHGKGFAVVAEEVRKLAEQSAQSTEQIREMIEAIQLETSNAISSMEKGNDEVEKGIEVVNNAGESFTAITHSVNTIKEQIIQVTSNIKQISSGTDHFVNTFNNIKEIADNTSAETQNVSASTEQQLASMEEIRASAASLSQMAEELQDVVQRFKL